MFRQRKRLWAILLSAALVATQLPVAAMAETTAEDGVIQSFAALDSGVANQTVPFGAAWEDLDLPTELECLVYRAQETAVPDSGEPDHPANEDGPGHTPAEVDIETPPSSGIGESGHSAGEDGVEQPPAEGPPAEADTEASPADPAGGDDPAAQAPVGTVSTEAVPVTWESDPAYDGETPGDYLLTPVPGADYTVSEGAALPCITVTVAASNAAALSARAGDEFEVDGVLYKILTNGPDSYTVQVWGWGTGGPQETLTLPEKVSDGVRDYDVIKIYYGAFVGDDELKTVDLSGATALTLIDGVIVPSSFETAYIGAFAMCDKLSKVISPAPADWRLVPPHFLKAASAAH